MMIVIAVLAARIGAYAGRLAGARHGRRGARSAAVAVTIVGLLPMLVSFAVSNRPRQVTALARHSFVVLGRYQNLVDRATAN